ncbi:MAG: hypothetical protein E7348_05185 [Clostridiales bacterium]|nr:hypothetical protein [Clostridiales bacterium]
MKNIKKLIVILLMAVFTMTCFTSCFDFLESFFDEDAYWDDYYETYYSAYDYELNKDRVVKIDLIDYTPEVTEWWDRWGVGAIPDYEYKPFDQSKVVVKEELPEEEIDAFLYELSAKDVYQIDQKDSTSECNTPYGRCVRISYNDGTFDLISYGFFYREEDSYKTKLYDSHYTKFLADGEIVSIEDIGYNWYALVAANYFDTKIVPIECEVEFIQIGEDI